MRTIFPSGRVALATAVLAASAGCVGSVPDRPSTATAVEGSTSAPLVVDTEVVDGVPEGVAALSPTSAAETARALDDGAEEDSSALVVDTELVPGAPSLRGSGGKAVPPTLTPPPPPRGRPARPVERASGDSHHAAASATPPPTAKSTTPFGRDTALGNDPESAMGALLGGTATGDGYGYGGLGVKGTGRGGGGTGSGTIGLGDLGSIGRGASGSRASGYGKASGPGSAGTGVVAPTPSRTTARGAKSSTPVVVAPPLRTPPARSLTAATVPDVDRRPEYLDYLSRHGHEGAVLALDMTRRIRFRVIDARGMPVDDAAITVAGDGVVLVGRTRADGYWDLFPSEQAPALAGPVRVYVQVGSLVRVASLDLPAQGDSRDIHIRFPDVSSSGPTRLDLAFLIDVTGSMGDELTYVTEEVAGIVERVRSAMPQVQVRVAATLYRDRGDSVPLQQVPFTADALQLAGQLGLVSAGGGGDYPEDMNAGLAAALTTLDWTEAPAVRVLVLIADAPPQPYLDSAYTYHDALADASARGIRILPVAASGSDRTVEYLLRAMGAFTGTPYVYLTDDSGIGNPHMEADTDRISVEMFSDLLTRLVVSDLRGHGMHEPEVAEQAPLVQLTRR